MTRRCILTIEDDGAIRRGIVDALEYAGYEVMESGDGKQGADLALHCEYDLLLLDLVLPGVGGLDILQRVRAARPTLPVIILTARGAEYDRVEGLRKGAVSSFPQIGSRSRALSAGNRIGTRVLPAAGPRNRRSAPFRP